MDEVQKPSDSECYTPALFRFNLWGEVSRFPETYCLPNRKLFFHKKYQPVNIHEICCWFCVSKRNSRRGQHSTERHAELLSGVCMKFEVII
jgi:hypothetical protein